MQRYIALMAGTIIFLLFLALYMLETGNLHKVTTDELLLISLGLSIFGLTLYIRELITSQKMKELQHELEQFVSALNETAIVSKTDLKGRITYVNDKFCEISGFSKDELIGKPHNIVRHPDVEKELFRDLWATIKSKQTFKETIKNRSKDGEDYIVDSVIIPILDIDGNIKEYLSVRYFVNEFVKSRDAAIASEKIKDEFISNVSHELRTPVNAINGFSKLLQENLNDKKNKQYVKHIVDSSECVIGLINDILDLSKLKSGNFSLDYNEFKPYQKLAIFLDRFESLVIAKDISFTIELDKSLKTILYGDWLRISQIVSNLLSNAIKFTPNFKDINFKAKYEDDRFVFEVIDEGIGMSAKEIDKIFKPYQQAKKSTTREYGGTGLGLSIVLNLVQQMGGDIDVLSQEKKGSSFKVSLPLKEIKEKKGLQMMLKGHILVAEDDKTNQILVGAMLSNLGLTYTMVDDGEEAVEMFDKEKFDLVLLDENMPKLNGSEALNEIRTKYDTQIPVVALTGESMVGVEDKYKDIGMSGYVAKPIFADKLYEVLKPLLDKTKK